jgi:hypothetical protein
LDGTLASTILVGSRKLSTGTFVYGRVVTVTEEEKNCVLPDWDLGRKCEEAFRRKDREDLLEFDARFWRG